MAVPPGPGHRDLPVARLRSHAREVGLSGLVMQGAWRRGVRAYLRLFHRLEVVGRRTCPPGRPMC
ncbi:hypothetical protein ACFQU7_11215 [Pseudoroseomonas wenyumeiae]